MAITIKSLGDGQLASSKGTLYTVPASTSIILKSITLVNTDTSLRTVNLYVKPAAASRRIIPVDFELPAGQAQTFETEVYLEAADLIEGDASVASKVDYVMSGILVT